MARRARECVFTATMDAPTLESLLLRLALAPDERIASIAADAVGSVLHALSDEAIRPKVGCRMQSGDPPLKVVPTLRRWLSYRT